MAETDENGVEGTAVFLIQSDGLHEFSVSLHNSQSYQENALDYMLDVVGTSFSQEYADAVEAFPASPVWSTDSSYSQCLCHSPYLYALAFGDERPCLPCGPVSSPSSLFYNRGAHSRSFPVGRQSGFPGAHAVLRAAVPAFLAGPWKDRFPADSHIDTAGIA